MRADFSGLLFEMHEPHAALDLVSGANRQPFTENALGFALRHGEQVELLMHDRLLCRVHEHFAIVQTTLDQQRRDFNPFEKLHASALNRDGA